MSSEPTTRPAFIVCEGCAAPTEQNRFGAPRRYCDDCRAARYRDGNARRGQQWKRDNYDRHLEINRASHRRRRAAGRLS